MHSTFSPGPTATARSLFPSSPAASGSCAGGGVLGTPCLAAGQGPLAAVVLGLTSGWRCLRTGSCQPAVRVPQGSTTWLALLL